MRPGLALLAACGNDAQIRMLTGAGIGALAGAVLGGMTTPAPGYRYPQGGMGRSPFP